VIGSEGNEKRTIGDEPVAGLTDFERLKPTLVKLD
jgi:hypothetical protein